MKPRPNLAPSRIRLHLHHQAPGVDGPAVSPHRNLSRQGRWTCRCLSTKSGEGPCQPKLGGARRSSAIQPVASVVSSLPPHCHPRPDILSGCSPLSFSDPSPNFSAVSAKVADGPLLPSPVPAPGQCDNPSSPAREPPPADLA